MSLVWTKYYRNQEVVRCHSVQVMMQTMNIANRIGTGAFGKERRAAGSAQNPRKGKRTEMMALSVAVAESCKTFRAAPDVGRVSLSGLGLPIRIEREVRGLNF